MLIFKLCALLLWPGSLLVEHYGIDVRALIRSYKCQVTVGA